MNIREENNQHPHYFSRMCDSVDWAEATWRKLIQSWENRTETFSDKRGTSVSKLQKQLDRSRKNKLICLKIERLGRFASVGGIVMLRTADLNTRISAGMTMLRATTPPKLLHFFLALIQPT